MTKLFFTTAVAILGLLNLNAQEKGNFEIGGGLGVNFSNVATSNDGNNTKSLIGFNAGASGEYYFSDRWGIKAKLIYDGKGWADAFIVDDNSESIITDFNLNYITIPVMANWHFGGNRNWYLHFGPYIGFLTSAKDSKLDFDLKEAFKSTDAGLAFGIGHKFKINDSTKLYIEYDGQSGLSDIFVENDSGASVLNGRSSFNIGALFNL